jgi:Fic family protein
MREYQKTHPWLNFQVDLKSAPPELWLLLGEAQSKCEHLAGIPLPPHVHEQFNRLYLAKGALATTAIEGNTLSEQEVLAHMQGKLDLAPSKAYLEREIANVIDAVNSIWHDDTGRLDTLCVDLIKEFNRLILAGLELGEGVEPGVIRKHSVGVGKYRAVPASDCEYLLEQLCAWLHSDAFAGRDENRIATAILKAILAHLYLAWIHPFGDGNGRTARMVEFQILVTAGVPMASAHLLSNHYNATKSEYYRQLDRASSTGAVIPFLTYAVRGFVDDLREQVEHVKSAQLQAAWKSYVHESFPRPSTTDKRRENLVLALTGQPAPVPRADLTMLTPQVAAAYARKTTKTLTRDLNVLRKMALIRRKDQGWVANVKLMRAFLPMRKRKGEPTPSERAPRSSGSAGRSTSRT